VNEEQTSGNFHFLFDTSDTSSKTGGGYLSYSILNGCDKKGTAKKCLYVLPVFSIPEKIPVKINLHETQKLF